MMNGQYSRIAGALTQDLRRGQGPGSMGGRHETMVRGHGPRSPLSNMFGTRPEAWRPAMQEQAAVSQPAPAPMPAPAAQPAPAMATPPAPTPAAAPAPIQQPIPGPTQFNPLAFLQQLQSGNWIQGNKKWGQGGGMGSQMAGGQGQNPGGNSNAPGGWA